MKEGYLKGRGAQINTENRFLKHHLVQDHVEGIDNRGIDDRRNGQIGFGNQIRIARGFPEQRIWRSIQDWIAEKPCVQSGLNCACHAVRSISSIPTSIESHSRQAAR